MSIFYTGINPLNKFKAVPVFLTINSAYAPYAAAAINSLMQHTDPKRYYRVIILHDGLNLVNRWRLRHLVTKNCAIQFKKMTSSLYLKAIVAYCTRRKKGAGDFFSSAVYYYRFFIPRMFPIYEKAVYIDSDTILRDDIGKLYDIELGDKVVAAMVDPKVTAIPEFRDYVDKAMGVPHDEYVNDGVMVMDLKKMRKMKYLSTMISLIKKYDADLVAPDQDYLNVILKGKILHLDPCWNAEPVKDLPKNVKLVHFNLFNKPWRYKNVPCERIFWNAAKGTGFTGELKRQQAAFDEEKQKADHEKVAALIQKGADLAKTDKPLLGN
ncbi:glycosyltransferase family 8 protein [Candidatus Saccharibacteria bacterium]|nr:glycosyltransferase family 8 protein [Candidatus Saccharibacteria bacterium]MBR3121833.1 glycosyltransferase family 8 protein [Candidatus Saccharibacteria bacterium]